MTKILIVDDASKSRELIAKLLQQEGYETSVAGCGTDALVRLKQNKPDMILLDHMMPEVDGLTFLAGIRRFPKWKELPVIMMSGLKDRQCQMKAHTLGVREYLVKSEFTPTELLGHIQRHLTSKPVGAGF